MQGCRGIHKNGSHTRITLLLPGEQTGPPENMVPVEVALTPWLEFFPLLGSWLSFIWLTGFLRKYFFQFRAKFVEKLQRLSLAVIMY